MKTVLNYIEELEKITNEVDKQFIHKDRIYELTEEMNKQANGGNSSTFTGEATADYTQMSMSDYRRLGPR